MKHSPGVTTRQCEQITFGRVWMLATALQRGIQAIKGAACVALSFTQGRAPAMASRLR